MRLPMLVSLAILLASCDRSTSVSIDIRAAGTPEVAVYEVALFEGGSCPGVAAVASGAPAPILSVAFPPSSPMALGERRESGPHALAVLGRTDDCAPVSFGCTSFVLGETDVVTVTLSTVETFADPACGERSCDAGRCVGDGLDAGMDAGPRDAGPDGGFDAGDASVDGGADCGSCGDPAIARCVDGACTLVETTPDVHDVTGGPEVLNAVRLAHTTGPLTVHVGTLEAVAGGAYRAVVASLPLASLDGTAVRTELPENAPLTLANSLDLQGDENTLHWSVAGRTEPASTVGVWIGTMVTPGTLAGSLPLAGPNTEIGLGPQLILGGNGRTIRYLSVTRDEGAGVLQAGSVPPSPSVSDYRPWNLDPVPGGSEQSAASAGGVVVMEYFNSRDLAVWRPYPEAETQTVETQPEGSTGPLALADLGGERYMLAHPVGDTVRLVATDCDEACTFVSDGTIVSSGDTLQALALVGTPNEGALLVEGIESATEARVTLRPVDRNADAGAPVTLWTRPATERVVALAAELIVTPGAHELVVAAVSQDRANAAVGRVGLIRVAFSR